MSNVIISRSGGSGTVSVDKIEGILPIEKGGTGNTTGLAASATQLATARTIITNLASSSSVSFNGTAAVTPGVMGTLPVAYGGTGNNTGLAATATILATSRTIQVNLSSTSSASFNGSVNITPGITGTLSVENGGTGANTADGARTALETRLYYNNPTELGLTTSCTMDELLAALPSQSSIVFDGGSFTNLYPETYCTIRIDYVTAARPAITAYTKMGGYIYIGKITASGAWDGWSKVASDDDVQSCLTSVSDGKTLIASAITDMGVSTSSTDTFSTMASNIATIEGSDEIGDIVVPSIYDDALDDSYLLCDGSLISSIDYPELTSIDSAYTGLMPSIYPILYTTFGSSSYDADTGFVIGDYMVYNYSRSSTGNYMTLTGFSWSSGVSDYYTAATKYGNGYYVGPYNWTYGYAMVGTSLTSGSFVKVSSNYDMYDCAFGNSLFVMGCTDGSMYSSSTGATWTASATISGICYNVIYACDKFIAFTTTGTYYSASGTSWTLCSGTYPSSSSSSNVVAVYDENRNRVFYKYGTSCYISTDGITWSFLGTSNISISGYNRLTGGFTYDPDRDRMFVITSGEVVYMSTDGGLNWSRMYVGTTYISASICYFQGYYFLGSDYANRVWYINADNLEYYMLPTYTISESSGTSKLSSQAYIKAL